MEPSAVLLGDPDRLGRRSSRATGAITTTAVTARRSRSLAAEPSVPAVQRRARARRPTTRRSPSSAIQTLSDGTQGVRRAARRGLLRRPRIDLRPRRAPADPEQLHLIPMPGSAMAVNATKDLNVHSIALQIPMTLLTADGNPPTDPKQPFSVIGVWTTASPSTCALQPRRAATTGATPRTSGRGRRSRGSATRCSTRCSSRWSARTTGTSDSPFDDSQYADGVLHPELAKLLPVLYPGAFPNLARSSRRASRAPTSPPSCSPASRLGVVSPNFQNFTGTTQADLLRLNMAIPPSSTPNNLGVVGGDLAGFPNGRRIADDVVTIELKAIAGATYPLIDPTYMPDARGRRSSTRASRAARPTRRRRAPRTTCPAFPYLGHPHSGYDVPAA